MTEKIVKFNSTNDLKVVLAKNYMNQINNFFGDEKQALKFLSGVMSDVTRIPKLMECEPSTIINSYMMMAQLELMPSGVSGEAYVLPYFNKDKGVTEAQFQLGYQGLVTLFYRAGIRSITAEIVYENDNFSVVNGEITHKPDYFSDRGKAKGAYVIVELQAGGKISKVMNKEQIMDIGKRFSKSFASKYSPWNEDKDPDLWMWKKTVLKQVAKLVPKNETIYKAIAEDNKDSIIADRLEDATEESKSMKMGNLLNNGHKNQENKDEVQAPEGNEK